MKAATTFAFVSLAISCASIGRADMFGSGANTFNIDFVHVGNPGNTADTTGVPNPAGKVDYTYRMGKYEISEDMIDKANAEGGLGITYYDFPGVDKPATNISWYEAARFVNWLNTSTGHSPAYKFDLQPGDPGYNTFQDIALWSPGDPGYNPSNPFRNSNAFYFLPSTDEWYKAAYYDPAADVYYNYPTGSDGPIDGIDFAGDTDFDAVFYDEGFNNDPNDITDVGVLSPYGTAGQGGNVEEWDESAYDLVNNSTSEARGVRGGFWLSFSGDLQASFRHSDFPTYEVFHIGFRVASVPEPSTVLLLCLGALGVAALRRSHGKP
jgi:Sulfatase-modifying factor enzyme 1/PEP-CTERM motif